MGTENSKQQPGRATNQSSNFPRSTTIHQSENRGPQHTVSGTIRSNSNSHSTASRTSSPMTSATPATSTTSSMHAMPTAPPPMSRPPPAPSMNTSPREKVEWLREMQAWARILQEKHNDERAATVRQPSRGAEYPTVQDRFYSNSQSAAASRTSSPMTSATPATSTTSPMHAMPTAPPPMSRPSPAPSMNSSTRPNNNIFSPSERSTQYNYSTDQLRSMTSESNVERLYPNLGNVANQRNEQQSSNSTAPEASRSSPMTSATPGTSTVYRPAPFARHSDIPSAPVEPDLPPAASYSARREPAPPRGPLTEQHCRTCHRLFGDAIYQCKNGHSSCDRCKSGGVSCGQCGGYMLSMRNYSLEEHLRELKVSCPNMDDGCVMYLRRSDMTNHLCECIFRVMDCPLAAIFGKCTWRGKRGEDMLRHFDNRHPETRRVGVNEEGFLQRPCNRTHRIHFVVLNNYYFLVHIKISEANETFSMAVQLLGTKNGASKWSFEISLYNKAEPRRNLSYYDACAPDGDSIDDIFNENRCLVVPLAYVRSFANERGLNYKFFITKTGENGRPQRVRQRKHPGKNNRQWSQGRNENWRNKQDKN